MITFKHVSKTYSNHVVALSDVSFHIEAGAFVAIIGLSGAGKSTLIRLINKMIDKDAGTIIVNNVHVDHTLKNAELRAYRRHIGMVFQAFNLIPKTNVMHNVLVSRASELSAFRSAFSWFPKALKLEALDALEKLNILDKAFDRIEHLSGGQQQRVALARTLMQKPYLILADEPTASLDNVMAKKIMEDFSRINEKEKITVIVNMHNVDLALQYATRVIGIKAGKIVYDDTKENLTQAHIDNIYDMADTSS